MKCPVHKTDLIIESETKNTKYIGFHTTEEVTRVYNGGSCKCRFTSVEVKQETK